MRRSRIRLAALPVPGAAALYCGHF